MKKLTILLFAAAAFWACTPLENEMYYKPNAQIMMQLYPEIYSCIGCNACARVCPKNCQTHVPADQIAA